MPAAKRNTCTACRTSKLRCDRGAPACGRCHKLGIACIEQVRSQGRPPRARLVEPVRPESPLTAGDADGGASVGSAGATSSSRKRPHEEGGSSQGEYSAQALVSLLSHGFGAFQNAGRVQLEKATSLLRAWNLVSETHGKDTSYGAYNQIVRQLGLDHQTAIFVQQRPPGCSGKRIPGRRLVEPATPAAAARLPPALREMVEGGQAQAQADAVAYYVLEDGHVQLGVNAAFEALLMGAADACDFLAQQAVLPVFFWGCLFTATSQEKLYRHLSQALFCHPAPVGDVALVLECVDRQGQPFFGTVTIRATVDGEGAYAACALAIAPLAPSSADEPKPKPHVVGTSLLPTPKPPKPRPPPAVKQEPGFPLLRAYQPAPASAPPAVTAVSIKPEIEWGEADGPFTSSIKAACGGAWGYNANWGEDGGPSPVKREWAGAGRARRPSARAREAEASEAVIAAATSGEDEEDYFSVVSSVSSGSGGERGGSARKKRRRVARSEPEPEVPPLPVVAVPPGVSLIQCPYLHRAPMDPEELHFGHAADRHADDAGVGLSPARSDSIQTGDTSSEDGADEEAMDPFHTVAAAVAAGPPPQPPMLCRATSSTGGSGSYVYGGARRTVGDYQSALLSLAAASGSAETARAVAPAPAPVPPVGLPKPALPATAAAMPAATSTASAAAHDDDLCNGYNYTELLSFDMEWDLLAPSPLMRMDGFAGRAAQQQPQVPCAQQHPQPLAHISKAEPAVDGGMVGYGLI